MTRKICWTINVIIILTLVWLNFVPSGVLVIDHQIGERSANVTDFRPGEKLIAFQKDGDQTFHTLTGSPIFFHIRTPRQFQKLDAEITYRAFESAAVEFGEQTGEELYEFVYEDLEIIPDGKWHTTTVSLDLGRMYYHKDTKRYQFSFITNKNVDISAIKSTFTKPPITINKALDKYRPSS
ncbi:MAG: hypothetical protein CMI52_00340 [Parcubacteria group bacterium]|nr:hypothetical protein [Parcubacteria group bacterium]|tara:strand:+ start:1129 stop:1671 length:543 start_codon:yes stop_codon:yes gene_type:complete